MAYGQESKMEKENSSQYSDEDEELLALRKAALATLKRRSSQKEEEHNSHNHSVENNHIVTRSSDNFIRESNHIPFIHTDRPSQPSYASNSWKKSNNVRRRGALFPKSSQRSNLIVISPVSLDGNKSSESESLPALERPQRKWYHSGNEDSMSPKTYRKTGPSRFNRHESDSSSSDSDFDNSDDSCSNETVLQDEPSEKFSNSSREVVTAPEVPKRAPVQMRLGNFPRKRVIQMTKDVEAAFMSSSSDDDIDVNSKCKKPNLPSVIRLFDNKKKIIEKRCNEEPKYEKRSDVSRDRSRSLKAHR